VPVTVVAGGISVFLLVIFFGAPLLGKGVVQYMQPQTDMVTVAVAPQPTMTHVQKPEHVRAAYMSQCAAATPSFRERIRALLRDTELNAVVLDIKDYTGTVSFPRDGTTGEVIEGSGCFVSDMQDLIDMFHEDGVYVIGRITVFQDPLYAKKYPHLAVQSKSRNEPWKDHKGLSFIDVGARPFWDYIVAIARDAQNIGFDELNFDYIRYPSDGPMSDVHFVHSDYSKRPEELERFFAYLTKAVRRADASGYVPVLSADLFGMTTTNTDDLTIGQVLERVTPYFDYIAPMTYPSHYPPGFNGYANPNHHVYGVMKYSVDRAIERVESPTTTIAAFPYVRIGTSTPAVYKKPARSREILRPWIQDFDYGGEYGPREVRDQIQALYDSGIYSWMLWSPSNRYTKEALERAQ